MLIAEAQSPTGRQAGPGPARDGTRALLIRIGTEILSEKGFDSTGLEEVLRRADVPKGSFYHYFKSKADFGIAVIDNYDYLWEQKITWILRDPSVAPRRRIENYVAECAYGLEKYAFKRGCLIGNMAQELGSLNDLFRERILRVFASWAQTMQHCLLDAREQGQIAADADIGKLSKFFWYSWEGAILQCKLERSTAPIFDFSAIFLSMIFGHPARRPQGSARPRNEGDKMTIPAHRVAAVNTAKDAENKMHDDTVAKRFGFTGGLVPGVDVCAYVNHIPARHWGRAFLERGRVDVRLLKPIYEGDAVSVTATEDGDALELEVRVEARDVLCATARAYVPADVPAFSLGDYPYVAPPATEARVPFDEALLRLDMPFCNSPVTQAREDQLNYLRDISETDPVYERDSILHFGTLVRAGILALPAQFVTKPWIHAATEAQCLGLARVGDALDFRGRIVRMYERRGHKIMDVEGLVVANGARPVMWLKLVEIYGPREAA